MTFKRLALREGLEIQVRSWEDEHVLWDNNSGDTHLLDEHSFGALLRIAEQSRLGEQHIAPLDSMTLEDVEFGVIVEHLLRIDLIESSDR